MVDNRYRKILTIIIVIIAVGALVSASFFGYDIYKKIKVESGIDDFENEFDTKLESTNEITDNTNEIEEGSNENANSETTSNSSSNKTSSSKTSTSKKTAIALKYKGFDVAGKIEIPAINIKYPVLTVATNKSMQVSVGIVYGPGLNKPGNTTIMGHNYRNGTLFSKNDKLKNGDEIFITDLTGKRVRYVIYNKYNTSSTDFDYATRDTKGATEITLESCTNDSKARIIIWAKAS